MRADSKFTVKVSTFFTGTLKIRRTQLRNTTYHLQVLLSVLLKVSLSAIPFVMAIISTSNVSFFVDQGQSLTFPSDKQGRKIPCIRKTQRIHNVRRQPKICCSPCVTHLYVFCLSFCLMQKLETTFRLFFFFEKVNATNTS